MAVARVAQMAIQQPRRLQVLECDNSKACNGQGYHCKPHARAWHCKLCNCNVIGERVTCRIIETFDVTTAKRGRHCENCGGAATRAYTSRKRTIHACSDDCAVEVVRRRG